MSNSSDKLAKKLWEIERKEKANSFSKILREKITEKNFQILEFQFADEFIKNAENYPEDKYQRNLFEQIKLNDELKVLKSIENFLAEIEESFAFIFCYNYNFGITKINKKEIVENWKTLVDIDKDEIMIFNPKNGKFLSIELTEEFMNGNEEIGRIKFYELTISEK